MPKSLELTNEARGEVLGVHAASEAVAAEVLVGLVLLEDVVLLDVGEGDSVDASRGSLLQGRDPASGSARRPSEVAVRDHPALERALHQSSPLLVLREVLDVELLKEDAQMRLDGVNAQIEVVCYLLRLELDPTRLYWDPEGVVDRCGVFGTTWLRQ